MFLAEDAPPQLIDLGPALPTVHYWLSNYAASCGVGVCVGIFGVVGGVINLLEFGV